MSVFKQMEGLNNSNYTGETKVIKGEDKVAAAREIIEVIKKYGLTINLFLDVEEKVLEHMIDCAELNKTLEINRELKN